MKVKKEYLILAVVIVALVAYLALHNRDRNLYELPAIEPVDTKQITRLEVSKATEVLVLEKTGSDWYITPQSYLADSLKVKEMLAVAEKLTLTELISESKKYQRYDLDETDGIVFKCWAKKDLRFELIIGKTADSNSHTFVRLPGDAAVYHAQGNFRDKFDKKTGDFREKTVLAFDQKTIGTVEISADGATEIFNRVEADTKDGSPKEGSATIKWVDSAGVQADTEKIAALLSTLSNLKCESYLEGKGKEELSDPVYTLVLNGAKSYTLKFYAEMKVADEAFIPAVSSENDHPFLITKWQSENIMKKPEELKKNQAQAE